MYRNNVCCLDLPEYPVNELGKPVDAIEVDQFYSGDFMKGENGFCRSDISQMLHTQSEELRQVIANRLVEVKAEYPDQNLSDEVLCKLAVPRYVQSQHDFREWASQIDELGFNKSIEEFVKSKQNEVVSDSPESIKFNEGDDPKSE